MVQLKLVLCAESVIRDAETNNISVVNILEELGASAFPVVIPKLSTLFLLERTEDDPQQIDGTVIFVLDGEEIGRAAIQGDFEDKLRNRLILVAQGVGLGRPGTLSVTLVLNDRMMGAWNIIVRAINLPMDEDEAEAKRAADFEEVRNQIRARGSRRLR